MTRARLLAAVLVLVAGFMAVTVVLAAAMGGAGQSLQAQAAGAPACVTGADQALAPPGPSAASSMATRLTGAQVAKAAYAAGFRGEDLVIAVAVARAESDWHPRWTNANNNGSTDFGLFQINSIHSALLAKGDWRDPTDNARMAYQVWTAAGQRWGPWVTFWRGTYRAFVGDARAAVEGSSGSLTGLLDRAGCSGAVVVAGGLTDPGTGAQGSDGLTPRAEAVKAATLQRWGCKTEADPCISTIGGYAPRMIAGTGTPSDHASGNADDIMLPDYTSGASRSLGNSIAQFWVDNAARAGIHYVIFNHQIWSREHSNEGWRPYRHPSGAHSPTLDHENHVHVSVLH